MGCAPLAGKSTLNRLEHAPAEVSRYHKIGHDPAAIEGLFIELFLDAHDGHHRRSFSISMRPMIPCTATRKAAFSTATAPPPAAHGPTGGCYCYLPLYVFCGRHLLAAKLRRSDIDASAGAGEEVARIVAQIRARWPRVHPARADSGFARDELMAWCEANRVDYVFGLARNERRWARSPTTWPRQGREFGPGRSRAALHRVPGRATAGAGSAGSSPRPSTCPRGRIRASSSPPCRPVRATLAPSTRTSTAPAARSRTGSRSSSSTSSPIARRRRPCAPISSACGSRRSPMWCSTPCGGSACGTRSSPPPPVAPSGSSS